MIGRLVILRIWRSVRCGDSDDRFIDDSYFIKLYDTLFLLAPGEMFANVLLDIDEVSGHLL